MTSTGEPAPVMPSSFSADQYADNYPPGIENSYWTLARNRFIADALKGARRDALWSGADPILEIGCGPGIVLQFLRERGYDAWGVELASPPLLQSIASYVHVGIDACDLDSAFRNGIAAILLLDVIEHIEQPGSFLAEVAASFPNCRIFILTVPARQEIWSNYDTYYGHHRRYDRASLARTLRQAGLEPRVVRYFFRPLYLAALLLTLSRRPRRVVLRSPRHLWAHRLLGKALYGIERPLRPFALLPGLSLLSVATVPTIRNSG